MTEETTQQPEAKPSAMSFLEQAKQERERLDKLLAELREENKIAQEMKGMQMLGGVTTAGQAPEKPKEESPQEYAKRMLRGGK